MWELRGEYRRVGERRGKVRKWTDVPLHTHSIVLVLFLGAPLYSI
jgi:hypothetical protein